MSLLGSGGRGGSSASVSTTISALTNAAALKPVAAALRAMVAAQAAGAVASEFIIQGIGDSIMNFGGDVANQTSETLAEKNGFLACLRRYLNVKLGLAQYDGGCWIPASASASDTRVANSAGVVIVGSFCPYVGWRDTNSNVTDRRAASLEAAGHTVTVTFFGRYITPMQWENAASSYNGTYSYAIDGASAVNVVASGANDTVRMTGRIDCGTIGAHTVVFSWVSAKVLLAGFLVTNGWGVVTTRFGVGSTTALDWMGRQEKQQRMSFKTVPAVLQVIRFGYNDWAKQATAGELTTPSVFLTKMQAMIAVAQANPATKAILLMADPPTSSADTLTYKYDEYRQVLKSLATGSVAFWDTTVAVNSTWAKGNANGQYVDFVHPSGAGHDATGAAAADLLTDSSMLAG